MPQMAPMTWFMYETMFLTIVIMFLSFLFFLPSHYQNPTSMPQTLSQNWKW